MIPLCFILLHIIWTAHAFYLSDELTFNNSYSLLIEEKLFNLTYSIRVSNSYSNVFMIKSQSINYAEYCLNFCEGTILFNGTYANLTIWSWGVSNLQYEITSYTGNKLILQNNTTVYVILGLLIGFVVIISIFMPLWYCIGVSLCCHKNKKINITQIFSRNK